ncbi:hypothetical protein A9Q91_03110 [Candidatus Gracilibacteria bacterium 28_42_T64]|nr:hypothetical protein A9Q91_03110 [Candidatus Gracilibacteria bacterium 28_42_T64]
MKRIIASIICTSFLLFIPIQTYTYNSIDPKLKRVFSKFIIKLEKKYSLSKEIEFLNNLNKKLEQIKEKKKLSTKKEELVNDIIALSNEKLFSLELSQKIDKGNQQMKLFTFSNDFRKKIYGKENIFLEDGVWYSYIFKSYLGFPKGTNIRSQDLSYNNISTQDHLLFIKDDGEPAFVKEFNKIKLIPDDIIFGVPDKFKLLLEIKDDKITLWSDTDDLFSDLREKTIQLTKGLNREEKIQKIYSYVLDNTQYTKEIDLTDRKIFSGILTYKNNEGVCEGYAKYFTYMLYFAGIGDAEVIRGYVIDAQDFPNIGHAWVRVGDTYYDPTFDDPVGGLETREKDEYKYFNLPKDLLYTNRFNYSDLPEQIKNSDLNYRTSFIRKNLSILSSKYEGDDYNILKPIQFRKNNGLLAYETLKFSHLKNILPYYEVDNFNFKKDGKNQKLKKLSYYVINEDKIDNFLEQVQYNLDGYYLFKWKLSDAEYEYRIAYNVIY